MSLKAGQHDSLDDMRQKNRRFRFEIHTGNCITRKGNLLGPVNWTEVCTCWTGGRQFFRF